MESEETKYRTADKHPNHENHLTKEETYIQEKQDPVPQSVRKTSNLLQVRSLRNQLKLESKPIIIQQIGTSSPQMILPPANHALPSTLSLGQQFKANHHLLQGCGAGSPLTVRTFSPLTSDKGGENNSSLSNQSFNFNVAKNEPVYQKAFLPLTASRKEKRISEFLEARGIQSIDLKGTLESEQKPECKSPVLQAELLKQRSGRGLQMGMQFSMLAMRAENLQIAGKGALNVGKQTMPLNAKRLGFKQQNTVSETSIKKRSGMALFKAVSSMMVDDEQKQRDDANNLQQVQSAPIDPDNTHLTINHLPIEGITLNNQCSLAADQELVEEDTSVIHKHGLSGSDEKAKDQFGERMKQWSQLQGCESHKQINHKLVCALGEKAQQIETTLRDEIENSVIVSGPGEREIMNKIKKQSERGKSFLQEHFKHQKITSIPETIEQTTTSNTSTTLIAD